MATWESPQEGDIGTAFTVGIVDQDGNAIKETDFHSANDHYFRFQPPSGSSFDRDPDAVVTYSDPNTPDELVYYSQSGDLTPKGPWQCQLWVHLNDGSWKTRVQNFTVLGNL